jgi:hypothetical protein
MPSGFFDGSDRDDFFQGIVRFLVPYRPENQ